MREQIRARVDRDSWEFHRRDGESNTDLLGRILSEWSEQKAILSALSEIDPSPSQALGRLLLSYELLQSATVTLQLPEPPSALPVPTAPPAVSASPVPTIGGLENNSGDW